jgi:hypothetical protein
LTPKFYLEEAEKSYLSSFSADSTCEIMAIRWNGVITGKVSPVILPIIEQLDV